MKQTLKIIQILAKVGLIFSLVVFVCAIIGTAGGLLGIILLLCGVGAMQIGDNSFIGLIEIETGISQPEMYAAIIVAIIACGALIPLAWLAYRYFKHELKAGTPFTLAGAKELFWLGVITACVALGTMLADGILIAIMGACFDASIKINMELSSSVASGLVMMLFALIFKYGAETTKQPEIKQDEKN